jgi:hypothetical protein
VKRVSSEGTVAAAYGGLMTEPPGSVSIRTCPGIRCDTTMRARVRRTGRCRTAGGLLIAAVLAAGCGGGGEPSAEERRTALAAWAKRADAVCGEARSGIATRGAPVDLIDLDRVAVRAAGDVRAAIGRIRRLPVSEAARPRVRPFLGELERLEPQLGAVTAATKEGDMEALRELALAVRNDTRELQERARDLGLVECGSAEIPASASDALLAPVYATQLAGYETWFVRSFRRLARELPSTRREAAAFYGRAADLAQEAQARVRVLQPPERASAASSRYEAALAAIEAAAGNVTADLETGRKVTPAWARAVERRFERLDRRERSAMRRLKVAVGAQAAPVPPADPDAEDETEAAAA